MVTDMITLKLEKTFLKEIDMNVKEAGFQSRTEFIRDALREKMEDIRLKQALIELSKLKGSSKKKVTDEEYELAREEAFEKIARRFK